jgi:hypothetical protein
MRKDAFKGLQTSDFGVGWLGDEMGSDLETREGNLGLCRRETSGRVREIINSSRRPWTISHVRPKDGRQFWARWTGPWADWRGRVAFLADSPGSSTDRLRLRVWRTLIKDTKRSRVAMRAARAGAVRPVSHRSFVPTPLDAGFLRFGLGAPEGGHVLSKMRKPLESGS